MSSFRTCLALEERSKKILRPWVVRQYGNEPRDIAKTYDAQTLGDWIVVDATRGGYEFTVELKAEEDFTGNLFLETVSNGNTAPPRYGWLWTSRAEELWYHFLDVGSLYVCRLGLLKHWLLPHEDFYLDSPIDNYRVVSQQKYDQKNLTQGSLVPISDLLKHCESFREIKL